jgi:hypothetical protein
MAWIPHDRRTRLGLAALAVLATGLLLAVVIDQTAGDEPGPVLVYEAPEGGPAQPVSPDDSKQYLRSLEQFSGKTGIMLYQLRTWFAGLWRGRTLARTIFCLAAAGAAVLLYASRRLPPGGGNQTKTGPRGD